MLLPHVHTCYKMAERTPHPEIGAMIAKYLGPAGANLPSFLRMGLVGKAGAGYFGPHYERFSLDRDGRLPYFTTPYADVRADQCRPPRLAWPAARCAGGLCRRGVSQGQGVPSGQLPNVKLTTSWVPPAQRFQVRLILEAESVPLRVGMTGSVAVYTEPEGFLNGVTEFLHQVIARLYYL